MFIFFGFLFFVFGLVARGSNPRWVELEHFGNFLSCLCQSGAATSADIVLKVKIFSELFRAERIKRGAFVVACVWRCFDFSGQL